jgi:hypothetical protein
MEITPFDTIIDKKEIVNKEKIGGYCYGLFDEYYENNHDPSNKINKIEINYKRKKIVLTRNNLQNYYYEINDMSVHIGQDGELYIGLGGGGDSSAYYAWITIFNEKILQEFVMTSCW